MFYHKGYYLMNLLLLLAKFSVINIINVNMGEVSLCFKVPLLWIFENELSCSVTQL